MPSGPRDSAVRAARQTETPISLMKSLSRPRARMMVHAGYRLFALRAAFTPHFGYIAAPPVALVDHLLCGKTIPTDFRTPTPHAPIRPSANARATVAAVATKRRASRRPSDVGRALWRKARSSSGTPRSDNPKA